jgi:hypothetical protein
MTMMNKKNSHVSLIYEKDIHHMMEYIKWKMIYQPNTQAYLLVILTLSQYTKKPKMKFLKDQNDLLCPIIFFINKKHTDTYGQLFL